MAKQNTKIVVAEVGPRDGLQSFPRWVSTEDKVSIIGNIITNPLKNKNIRRLLNLPLHSKIIAIIGWVRPIKRVENFIKIAQKFNLDYEAPNFLKVPEPLIQKKFSRIMSLKDGTKKMSKSDPSDLSRINMTDTKDQIVNKIKKAKTDPDLLPSTDKDFKKRPELENLLGIYSSMKNQSLLESINEFSGKNFSNLKDKLSETIVEKITPISNEINKLQKDPKFIDEVLYEGAQKAEEIASKKIKEIKKIIGF